MEKTEFKMTVTFEGDGWVLHTVFPYWTKINNWFTDRDELLKRMALYRELANEETTK